MKSSKSKNRRKPRKLITLSDINICAALNDMIMKTQTFVQTDFKIQAFSINRIMFDDSDLVSIDVTCRLQTALHKTTLLFTFSKFNDLLRFSGESGDKLQILVSDKLLSNEEQPYIIDINKQPLIFSFCAVDISYLIADDTSCFSVEDITPISILQQAKNLRNNVKDFNNVHLDNKAQLANTLKEMASMYRYYLGLKELNLNENAAREKSGLVNDKLFKIAYHAAVSIK